MTAQKEAELEKEIGILKELFEESMAIYEKEQNFYERRTQYNQLQNFIIEIKIKEAELKGIKEGKAQAQTKLRDDYSKWGRGYPVFAEDVLAEIEKTAQEITG